MKFWDNEEIDLLKAFIEAKYSYKDIANELNRTYIAIKGKTQKLNISNGANNQFTNDEFLSLIQKTSPRITPLEAYKGITIPILFKCLDCGIESKAMPKSKLNGHKCKHCGYIDNGGHININEQGITYLVYISKFDLYKIGITSKTVKERMKDNKISDYETILEYKFHNGIDAMNLEKKWKKNLREYLVNTSLLSTGNTETFRI